MTVIVHDTCYDDFLNSGIVFGNGGRGIPVLPKVHNFINLGATV